MTAATAADAKVQLMFIQRSESLRADGKMLVGKVPTQGGATSLFIDWIGPGGGVGAGFHGVSAGGFGVGLR